MRAVSYPHAYPHARTHACPHARTDTRSLDRSIANLAHVPGLARIDDAVAAEACRVVAAAYAARVVDCAAVCFTVAAKA